LPLKVLEIRQPLIGWISFVVLRLCANFRQDRCVKRVGRQRHQYRFASVDDGGEGELESFGRSRCHEHAIRRHAQAARGKVRRHSFACFDDTG
jgi:hypothetical protein